MREPEDGEMDEIHERCAAFGVTDLGYARTTFGRMKRKGVGYEEPEDLPDEEPPGWATP